MKRTLTLTYYFPLVVTVTLVPVFSEILRIGDLETPNLGVFPEKGMGPVLNAVLWLSITALFGLLMVFLLRRYINALKAFIMAISVYTIFAISNFYLGILVFFELSMILSVSIASLSLYLLIKKRYTILYSIILLAVMVGLGIIFNSSFEDTTKIAILIAYSLFDIYSVYKGMIKIIFEDRGAAMTLLSPLLVRFGPTALGVGDVIFYSLLLSYALGISQNLFLSASIALIVGHTLNLWILKHKRIIPALPIPVMLTLSVIQIFKILF